MVGGRVPQLARTQAHEVNSILGIGNPDVSQGNAIQKRGNIPSRNIATPTSPTNVLPNV